MIAVWLHSVRPDDADKAAARDWESRRFSLAQTLGGMWHGMLNAEPDGGARLFALLESRAVKTGSEDQRTRDQRFYDAFMSIVDEALANAGSASSTGGGNVPEIIVHAQPGNLTGDPTAPPATREDGTPISRAGFDQIACDARWTRLLLDAVTQTLDLGRTTREWSPALRKVIHARATQIHHCNTWWRDGGTTCPDNGLLLCRWHHHCVHARGYTVKLLPDWTAIWTLPNGTTLESQPRGPTVALRM